MLDSDFTFKNVTVFFAGHRRLISIDRWEDRIWPKVKRERSALPVLRLDGYR